MVWFGCNGLIGLEIGFDPNIRRIISQVADFDLGAMVGMAWKLVLIQSSEELFPK